MLTCSKCGASVEKYANGKKCRACYNAYMAEYMLKRYHEQRALAVEYLGGCCIKCGTTEDLELDHRDRADKGFDIARLWSMKLDKFYEEVEKCQLLCKTHHIEKTTGELGVPHGGGLTGKRNCTCQPCRARKTARAKQLHSSVTRVSGDPGRL